MSKNGMYETFCACCGKIMYTLAINRRGDLPEVHCSKKCEKEIEYEKRFVSQRPRQKGF